MRINVIEDKYASVSLDADELVCLGNALYFYQKHYKTDGDFSAPGHVFHALFKQIVTARDLCQYGHLDGHTLSEMLSHELAANPDGLLRKKLSKMLDEENKTEDGENGKD